MELVELVKVENSYEKFFADIDGKILSVDLVKNNIKLLITIGPEGGFTEDEKKLLLQNDFKPIRLSKRILRAETAAIVAASRVLN